MEHAMRTTLDIDDDVYMQAKLVAQAESLSVGKAVSRLMREGLQANSGTKASAGAYVKRNGWFVVPKGKRSVTPQLVQKLADEQGV
jgi:hypothetical protein